MAFQLPAGSGITGTGRLQSGAPNLAGSAYAGEAPAAATVAANVAGYGQGATIGSTMLNPAIQTIWSKEILFQAMPVLRFEQFAVKKTELGVQPGLTVNFMRYNNLPIPDGPLAEGIRMKTYGITAQQYKITVAEQGFAVAVSELLLNASFDDIMASASRLLGRNMAMYMDQQAKETLQSAASIVWGYQPPGSVTGQYGIYNHGTQASASSQLTGVTTAGNGYYLTPAAVKDAVLQLASKNIPRMGETYVMFIHPAQSRQLRDTPEFIEVTKYAAPGNFMLGEIGRLYDVVFIETTQVPTLSTDPSPNPNYLERFSDGSNLDWRTNGPSALSGTELNSTSGVSTQPADFASALAASAGPGLSGTPGWDQQWPYPYPSAYGASLGNADVFEAIMLGDNAFGHAISLPVELRDGGVLDFGREHALAWYSIWGFGLITDSAVVKVRTNA
jgi:N4-gp56 family major capsid protein